MLILFDVQEVQKPAYIVVTALLDKIAKLEQQARKDQKQIQVHQKAKVAAKAKEKEEKPKKRKRDIRDGRHCRDCAIKDGQLNQANRQLLAAATCASIVEQLKDENKMRLYEVRNARKHVRTSRAALQSAHASFEARTVSELQRVKRYYEAELLEAQAEIDQYQEPLQTRMIVDDELTREWNLEFWVNMANSVLRTTPQVAVSVWEHAMSYMKACSQTHGSVLVKGSQYHSGWRDIAGNENSSSSSGCDHSNIYHHERDFDEHERPVHGCAKKKEVHRNG